MTIIGIFLNDELRTGGHRRYLELLEGLAARGNRVIVLLNEKLVYSPSVFEAIRIKARYRRRSLPPASWVFKRAVVHAVKEGTLSVSNADWILVHGETHFNAGHILAHMLGARILFGHRSNAVREGLISMQEERGRPFAWAMALAETVHYRRYEKKIARSVDLIVFQSKFDRDDFISRAPMPPERLAVIGGNIGEPRFKREYADTNRSQRVARIIFVGTMGRRKGVRYLVEALEILAERGRTNLRFEIIGPGPDKARYEELLAERGLSAMAIFPGRVSNPFERIASADLMVVPSLFDSFPDTVLEALHVGTPVIGSTVGGIPDQLHYKDLLFSPMDAVAIADRIERCIEEAGFYEKVRTLCSERKKAFQFNWEKAWEDVMISGNSTVKVK